MDSAYNKPGSVYSCKRRSEIHSERERMSADIIPTLIQLMGMEQPADMTGESLLVEK